MFMSLNLFLLLLALVSLFVSVIFVGNFYIYIIISLIMVSVVFTFIMLLNSLTFFGLIFVLVYSGGVLLLIMYVSAMLSDKEIKHNHKFMYIFLISYLIFFSCDMMFYNCMSGVSSLYISSMFFLFSGVFYLLISLYIILLLLMRKLNW